MSTVERKARFNEILQLRQNNISVLLENVEDPHNISAVLRTADSIGCSEIFILNNRMPMHKKWGGFRSSSGANKWVQVQKFQNTEDCVRQIRSKYKLILATHLATDSGSLYDVDFTQSTVIAFGNEATGITDQLLQYCDGNIVIPQVGLSKSLNISVACAVTLYEAFRQKQISGHYQQSSLTDQQRQTILDFWNANDTRLDL